MKYLNPSIRHPRFKQRGSVLIVTIIMILLLTILGLGTVSLNTTQTRIATNSADVQISFQTAEGAINQANTDLIAGNYTFQEFVAGEKGLYIFDPNTTPIWKTIDWNNSDLSIPGFKGSSNEDSKVIIELLPSFTRPGQSLKSTTRVFRITVRSIGASGKSPTILQSTVQIQE
jgi:type IV pilus assembly protein PilX